MLRFVPLLGLIILSLPGCASMPPPPPLTDDLELEGFVREVERDLESHAWQELLAAADPSHHRTQVVEHGMGEPQYIAELFGFHRTDNNIRRGDAVGWSDLERIEAVELHQLDTARNPQVLSGTVRLEGGWVLRLRASISRAEGRYVLTGGVG